jgi:hypothetical protein
VTRLRIANPAAKEARRLKPSRLFTFGVLASIMRLRSVSAGMPRPDPPLETRWKPGQTGNPGGISRERRRLINEAAEIAARVLLAQMQAVEEQARRDAGETITADVHRVVKDVLDRADGTARQSIDHTSTDGTMSPTRIVIEAADDNGQD